MYKDRFKTHKIKTALTGIVVFMDGTRFTIAFKEQA